MGLKIKAFLLVVSTVLVFGCDSSFNSEGDFLKWIHTPESGFIKKASANGFLFTMKYMPPEYLALMESNKGEAEYGFNELTKQFNNSRTFLFTLEHEVTGVDITNYGVSNMSEFKERMTELNFQIKNYMFLKSKNGEHLKPVLVNFENLYELGGKKSFYIVFPRNADENLINDDLDIVFEDPFFHTGINHFVFETKKIDNLPTLHFIK